MVLAIGLVIKMKIYVSVCMPVNDGFYWYLGGDSNMDFIVIKVFIMVQSHREDIAKLCKFPCLVCLMEYW